jgi:branched-chain amino acid transport system ATP-binding protein
MAVLLEAKNVSKFFGGVKALTDVSFAVKEGEILGMIGPNGAWYSEGKNVLSDFSLQLRHHEVVGLIGLNGAGKTTMFNCMAGVFPPTEGEVLMFGKNVNALPTHKRVEMGMARTFQNIKLFANCSAAENVMAGRHCRTKNWLLPTIFCTPGGRKEEKECRESALSYLEFVGLGEKSSLFARNLPYGEQRSLEIARALATEPKVILLDEPAAGMNEIEKDALQVLVQRIREELKITVLIIEHDMKVVMNLCDRIVVLNQGEKICEGTPQVVRTDEKVIEAYLGSSQGRRERFVKH